MPRPRRGASGHLPCAHALAATLRHLRAVASEIVLDLDGVSFIDSQGLKCILNCQTSCQNDGVGFALAPVTPQARRLFEVAGVLDRLPFTDEETPCS